VLDALARAQARATFFAVGRLARIHPELVRRAAREGHVIGNHTWRHRHPWTLTSAAARREVLDGATALADITGARPAYFRPPHGRLTRAMAEAAAESGQAILFWSLSLRDWGPWASAGRIAARLAQAQSGQIILAHDGPMRINRPDQLLCVLPDFLDGNRERWRYSAISARTRVR
jgi:peptidoglycan/xylan/chitin deacetylase (PgdA/CDA1 family)